MAEEDQEQKTEEPSQKRLQEALDKGNVPFSREISSFLILALLALLVGGLSPSMFGRTQNLLSPFVTDIADIVVDMKSLSEIFQHILFSSIGILAIPFLGAIVAAVASGVLQNGFRITTEPMMPKLERISPISGFKRIFSMRSLVEFLKGIIKISIVSIVGYVVVYPELQHLKQMADSSMESILLYLLLLSARLTLGVAIAMFFIALFDLLYQRFQHIKSLRMSKQELKDEYKQSEGDPKIKQQLRRLRMERAKKRMMAAVPKSDVVITNPTHFAVALKYDSDSMKAPVVVAKGQDHLALKIRELAREHNVEIVQNPPLARALYDSVELDEEIPTAHYEAVAKIISYVYKLKGKK